MNDYILYNELGRGAHTTVYKGRKKGQIDFVAICSYEKDHQKYVHNKVKKYLLYEVKCNHNLGFILM